MGGGLVTAGAPSLYELVGERGVTGVPGIARWLGWTAPHPDEDADIETWDEFCARISKEAA